MNVHKIVLYVLDFDNIGADSVAFEIENTRYANRCISPNVLSVETADIGKWSDESPLNRTDTCSDEIKRIFG